MKISFFLAWYDFWVGGFYDTKKQILYICPLPCCVFKVEVTKSFKVKYWYLRARLQRKSLNFHVVALKHTGRRYPLLPTGQGRHTDWTPVECECGWYGPTKDAIHSYEFVYPDDVEPMDYCPNCKAEV